MFISERRVRSRKRGQVERQRKEEGQLGFAGFKMDSVLSVGIIKEPGPCSTHTIAQMSFSQEKQNTLNVKTRSILIFVCQLLCMNETK